MPSSDPQHIPFILQHAMRLKPRTVLDIGCGYGKWGVLLREYLELWAQPPRVTREEWAVRIYAIEPCEEYIGPVHRAVYGEIFVQDMFDHMVTTGYKAQHCQRSYGLILAIDVLEHMERAMCEEVMLWIKERCKAAILSIPLGNNWLGANAAFIEKYPYEEHKSAWEHDDVMLRFNVVDYQLFDAARGKIGVYVHEGAQT